jgi:3-deoxy-D-manno-octulosonic-acid transferase/heptosyltransferase-1
VNILIVKLSAIGDVIHTLPALNAIRRQYPQAQITWVVEAAAAELIIGHPALNRVIVSRRKQWIKQLKGPQWKTALREITAFIQQLRDTRYDVVIDFHALLKSALLVFLARGHRKIGFGKGMQHMEHSYLVLNERVAPVDMEIHALTRQLMLIEAIGVHSREVVYDIPISADDERQVKALLAAHGMNAARPLLAINPVALWDTKLWFNDRFSDLADRLISIHGVEIVFTGAKADVPVIEEIRAMMTKSAANLAGKTSLKMLAAIYRKAVCVVSTDTGPMHLAAAVGTPVAAIFGPTAPWRTGPFGAGHQVIRTAAACSPCFQRRCEKNSHICMKEITTEIVMAEVEKILAHQKGSMG